MPRFILENRNTLYAVQAESIMDAIMSVRSPLPILAVAQCNVETEICKGELRNKPEGTYTKTAPDGSAPWVPPPGLVTPQSGRPVKPWGLPEPEPIPEPIPDGVYFNEEHNNFYDSRTQAGKLWDFHNKWHHRRAEFPTKPYAELRMEGSPERIKLLLEQLDSAAQAVERLSKLYVYGTSDYQILQAVLEIAGVVRELVK